MQLRFLSDIYIDMYIYVCVHRARQISNHWYLWNTAETVSLAIQSSTHLLWKQSLVALWDSGNVEIKPEQDSMVIVGTKKRCVGVFLYLICEHFCNRSMGKWDQRFLFSTSSYCTNGIAVTKTFPVTGKRCCQQTLKGSEFLKDNMSRNFPFLENVFS